ncbi:MAG: type III-B CRISPR module RAMP protein Cmr4 [Actinobacteria bacterium]|nr:type III-B CRISPR module RAMP protein Cmr4 [Actinomycetota bacterium]
MLTLYATAYLHPGAGSTTGAIDLPVQREVHNNLPVMAASSLKGALRQKAGNMEGVEAIFGPGTANTDKHAGALVVGEAKLLAMPIRSLENVFWWSSSPLVFGGLRRDLARIGVDLPEVPAPREGHAIVPAGSGAGRLILEELDFEAQESEELGEALEEIKARLLPTGAGEYLLDKFSKDFALVGDDDLRHLCRTGTQVSARVQLDDNKKSNNLWYEETLPPETIFYAVVLAQKARDGNGMDEVEVMRRFESGVVDTEGALLQVGGNETVGQGWCCVRLSDGGTR